MSTRANWFTDELATSPDMAEGPDPFSIPVEEIGKPIDLSDNEGRLSARLVELLRREDRVEQGGITCALKGRSDTCCSACPVEKSANFEDELGVLCRVARERERVTAQLAFHTLDPSCRPG